MFKEITLATEVAKVFNNIAALLSTKDQRTMEEFFKFIDRYDEEKMRKDADHDDLILWKQRKDNIIEIILMTMRRGK